MTSVLLMWKKKTYLSSFSSFLMRLKDLKMYKLSQRLQSQLQVYNSKIKTTWFGGKLTHGCNHRLFVWVCTSFFEVIEEGSRKAKSAYTIPINSTENGDMFTRLKQNHGQRDTLEVNGKSTLGRKVVSTPTFSDYEKKKQDTKLRRVMSLPNITSSSSSFYGRFFFSTIPTKAPASQMEKKKQRK